MKELIVFDPTNTVLGFIRGRGSRIMRRDGAEFKAQAHLYANYCAGKGLQVELVALPKGASHFDKRQFLIKKLRTYARDSHTFDNFTFFGHGHKKALNRKMVTYLNIGIVAEALSNILTDMGRITFFSCNTAKDPVNGFAKRFSELTGNFVIGHTGSGHTTRYPWKRMLDSRHKMHNNWWPTSWAGKKDLRAQLNSYPEAPFEYVDRRWNALVG